MAELVEEGGAFSYGGDALPGPAAVVTQYTGSSFIKKDLVIDKYHFETEKLDENKANYKTRN